MWKCPGCGEAVDDEFEVCWNCQRQKPSNEAVEPVSGPHELSPDDGTREVEVLGRKLVCSICENPIFREHSTLLNTPGLTFLGLDWANRSATTYICSRCGYIFWFLPPPS
jgi:hypothetical protein